MKTEHRHSSIEMRLDRKDPREESIPHVCDGERLLLQLRKARRGERNPKAKKLFIYSGRQLICNPVWYKPVCFKKTDC